MSSLTAQTGRNVAPAYYIVAAALVSLCAVPTIPETARRPLRVAGSDEMFQSGRMFAGLPPHDSGGVTVDPCRRNLTKRRGPN